MADTLLPCEAVSHVRDGGAADLLERKGILTMRSLILGIVFLVASGALANNTITYECAFLRYNGDDQAGLQGYEKPFLLTFIYDNSTKKAYSIGNQSSSEVALIQNRDGISFLEVTGSGNVMTTTITRDGYAVHSRHSIIKSIIIPSQSYGTCVVK